jgi:hypothetical protein
MIVDGEEEPERLSRVLASHSRQQKVPDELGLPIGRHGEQASTDESPPEGAPARARGRQNTIDEVSHGEVPSRSGASSTLGAPRSRRGPAFGSFVTAFR